MSATGYTPISLYYSTTASAAPTAGNLTNGEIAINITDGKLYYKDNLGAVQLIASKAGASGSVTSVAQSFTGGLISVSGSPITTSGTLALTVAGTSGGVPYFSSASTWASSAALTANAIVLGGGAGAAPATTTTGTGVVTALGVNTGTAGAFVVNGGALGTPSSGTLTNATGLPLSSGVTGTLPVANGGTGQTAYTDGQLLIGNTSTTSLTKATLTAGSGISITNGGGSITIAATGGSGTVTSVAQTFTGGIISVSGSPVTTSGTLALTVAGTSGGVPYFSSASTWASSAALTANALMIGGGAGAAPSTTTTGTGVVTALGVNTGSAGAFVVNGGALGTPSSGTLSSCTVDGTDSVGFRNIPINSQSAAYTLVLADSGKAILHPSTDANARTFTIPANGSVAYAIGTALTFINMTSQVVTIAITTDTMYLAGSGTTGSRSLAQYGVATAIKMTSTTWIISGSGLT